LAQTETANNGAAISRARLDAATCVNRNDAEALSVARKGAIIKIGIQSPSRSAGGDLTVPWWLAMMRHNSPVVAATTVTNGP
jgi:hypothetical protein